MTNSEIDEDFDEEKVYFLTEEQSKKLNEHMQKLANDAEYRKKYCESVFKK